MRVAVSTGFSWILKVVGIVPNNSGRNTDDAVGTMSRETLRIQFMTSGREATEEGIGSQLST